MEKESVESGLASVCVDLGREWGIVVNERVTREEIIRLITEKIIKVIEQGPDVFYTLMYRLDISEKKLKAVLTGDEKAENIAALIFDRQIQKVKSREAFRSKMNEEASDDMKW